MPHDHQYSKTEMAGINNHDLREYANALDRALHEIQIPWEALQCCDKSCTMHYSELQLFHDAIVKACVESGKECIAHTSKSGKTSALTGWNEFVKPYRDDSIFWHNIWKQCGSPRNAVPPVMRPWPMSCAGREKNITTL